LNKFLIVILEYMRVCLPKNALATKDYSFKANNLIYYIKITNC